jgi:hypothetical protein
MNFSIAKKALHLSAVEWRFLLEASLELFLAWVKVKFLPFRMYVKELEENKSNYKLTIDNQTINEIKYAINRFSKVSPFESRCLVRALAARRMLKRRNIQSTLYLGVARHNKNSLKAHAWLICNNIFVTGAQGHQQFTVITSYS